jgi:crotonobetainyl-CoA:carnitine CoA-transferase CaiB-like acyl-CoA transferase
MGGMMSVTGLPGQGPVSAGIAVADSAAGLYGALGALVALHRTRRPPARGNGCRPRCSKRRSRMMDFQVARYLVEGKVPPQAGNDHPYATPMGVYATRDGHINLGVGAEGHWRSFCKRDRPARAGDRAAL